MYIRYYRDTNYTTTDACVRVYTLVLLPPNMYKQTYTAASARTTPKYRAHSGSCSGVIVAHQDCPRERAVSWTEARCCAHSMHGRLPSSALCSSA